nr:hypothetical protein [Eubacterium sp.]
FLNPCLDVYAEEVSGESEEEVTIVPRDWEKYSSPYIYDQLNADEKAIYDEMYEIAYQTLTSKDSYQYPWLGHCTIPGEISTRGLDDVSILRVFSLFYNSNPQFYFLFHGYGNGKDSINLGVYEAFADGETRAKETNRVFDIVEEWSEQIRSAGDTRYARILAANTLLCDNLTYFHSEFNQSAYSVFIDRSTVCAGYALAFGLLMNYCDVPTVNVTGYNHLWNKCQLDNGKWYATDVTWNDGSGNREYYLNRADEHMMFRDRNNVHILVYAEYYPETDTEDYVGEDTHYVIHTEEDGSLTLELIKPYPTPDPGPIPTPDPGPDPTLLPAPEADGTIEVHDWERYVIEPNDAENRFLDMTPTERILYQNMYRTCMDYLITSKDLEAYSETDQRGVMGKLVCGNVNGSDVVSIFHVFLRENPCFYFVEYAPLISTVNGGNTTITIFAKPEYRDGATRTATTNEIFGELDRWLDIITRFDTRYERERAANEILCREFSFELVESRDEDVSVFLRKKTHYQGYSWAMYYLMKMSDVPVYIVYSAKNSGVAWNKVCLDDEKWYTIDVTYNDVQGNDTNGYTRYFNLSDAHRECMDPAGYHTLYRPENYPVCEEDLITEDIAWTPKQKEDGTWGWEYLYPENLGYVGHSWGAMQQISKSTCAVHGSRVAVCAVCGKEKTEELPLLDHTVVKDPAVAPTYESTGLTEGSHCAVCNAVLQKQEVVPKLVKEDPDDPDDPDEPDEPDEPDKPVKPVKTKYKSEWVKNIWYDKNGYATKYKMTWKHNKTGWWIVDNTGWYPKNQWQKIDGVWYYFKPNGYMAANEWYKGYWFSKSGAWTYKYKGSWHKTKGKWWFGDTSGWYAKNTTIWIDGKKYSFDKKGYLK